MSFNTRWVRVGFCLRSCGHHTCGSSNPARGFARCGSANPPRGLTPRFARAKNEWNLFGPLSGGVLCSDVQGAVQAEIIRKSCLCLLLKHHRPVDLRSIQGGNRPVVLHNERRERASNGPRSLQGRVSTDRENSQLTPFFRFIEYKHARNTKPLHSKTKSDAHPAARQGSSSNASRKGSQQKRSISHSSRRPPRSTCPKT